jgi:hypothetical protein
MVTNISEEPAASIFTIQVGQVEKMVGNYRMGLDVRQWKSVDHFILTLNLLSICYLPYSLPDSLLLP